MKYDSGKISQQHIAKLRRRYDDNEGCLAEYLETEVARGDIPARDPPNLTHANNAEKIMAQPRCGHHFLIHHDIIG